MDQHPALRRYDEGYRAGQAACLRTGSAAIALAALAAVGEADSAYVAGFEWALWDYNDANGLPAASLNRRWVCG